MKFDIVLPFRLSVMYSERNFLSILVLLIIYGLNVTDILSSGFKDPHSLCYDKSNCNYQRHLFTGTQVLQLSRFLITRNLHDASCLFIAPRVEYSMYHFSRWFRCARVLWILVTIFIYF